MPLFSIMEGMISKLIRTLIAALILALLYWVVTLIVAAVAAGFHLIVPAWVSIIVLCIFILVFVAFVLREWTIKL